MKIISWNCNSLKARTDHVLQLLASEKPTVLMLQETRIKDEKLPQIPNYYICHNEAINGRNGVAIISEDPIQCIKKDDKGRMIHAYIRNYHMVCIYAPNGGSVSSSVEHKLEFYENLSSLYETPNIIIGGDFNVLYRRDEHTVENPYTPIEHNILKKLEKYLSYKTETNPYLTWWDYRNNDLIKNRGMGIDKIYASSDINASSIKVLKKYRSLVSPADHAPIMITIEE